MLADRDPDGNVAIGVNYVTNNSWYNDPGPGAFSAMKEALHWDTSRYFNVYTNDASGALGYATFPTQSAGSTSDGVVLLWTSVGRDAPQGGIYDQGRTGTHEIGHYLGLFHTFQGSCGSANSPYASGDLIADTVAHPSPDFDCQAAKTSCSGGGQKPIENYMNYTNDTCMELFSLEQANRMRCSSMHYRPSLYRSVTGTNQLPAAEFTATANEETVDFENHSSDPDGTLISHLWGFGDGTFSTDAEPSHDYAEAGTYTVVLIVQDDDRGSSMHTMEVEVSRRWWWRRWWRRSAKRRARGRPRRCTELRAPLLF